MTAPLPKAAAIAILLTLVVHFLVAGKSLLIPLVIAVILWYLLNQMIQSYQTALSQWFRLPYGLAALLALTTLSGLLYGVSIVLGNSTQEVIQAAPEYQQRFIDLVKRLEQALGQHAIDSQHLKTGLNPAVLFADVARALSGIAGDASLILIYVIFLLLEHDTFEKKLRLLCKDEHRYQELSVLLHRVGRSIQTYISIKTSTSALTGLLTYLVMRACDVDFAAFWGLMFFLLNFIPNIGSLFAVLSALLVIWIQFDNLLTVTLIGIPLTLIQFTIGNLVEPRLMGRSLNLSPLVILISLVFWGSIWGILGMILCIPAMVIANIFLAGFRATRPIAIVLSAQGDIEDSFR